MKSAIKLFVFIYFLSNIFPGLAAAQEVPPLNSRTTISMDLQDASLKDILKLLSQQSGLNFIASKAVQDRDITLYMDNVPIKEAMDKLFSANNLSYELDKKANIFIVKDWGEPQIETITKVFPLKNASVSSSSLRKELTNILSSDSSSGGGDSKSGSSSSSSSGSSPGGTSSQKSTSTSSGSSAQTSLADIIKKILSSYGSVVEDARTNSLIVTDTPSRMPVIERTLAALDVPVPQVMLEVEMLDVSKDVVDKLGFNWSDAASYALQVVSASKLTSWPLASFAPEGGISGTKFTAGSVKFPTDLKLVFDFLRTRTDTKYLARPRLLTLNNETAEIFITKDEVVGKVETPGTQTSAPTVNYIRSTDLALTKEGTGIFLRVTPQINPDTNEITMVINPKSSVTNTSPLSPTNEPQADIEIRGTKSIVKVKDGETVILGGLIHRDRQLVTKKIPILGDIPFLGALFRHKNQTIDKERELLVFITPHIVKETDKAGLAQIEKATATDREQNTVSTNERYAAINTSLSAFEKKKK